VHREEETANWSKKYLSPFPDKVFLSYDMKGMGRVNFWTNYGSTKKKMKGQSLLSFTRRRGKIRVGGGVWGKRDVKCARGSIRQMKPTERLVKVQRSSLLRKTNNREEITEPLRNRRRCNSGQSNQGDKGQKKLFRRKTRTED